jgi:hypothetical protein
VGRLFDVVTVAAQAEVISHSAGAAQVRAPATYEF